MNWWFIWNNMSTSKYCCNQTKKARKTRLRSFERSFKKLLFAYVFFSFWSKQAFKTTVWSHFLWKNFHDFLTHKPRLFNWMLCLNGLSYKNELGRIWKIFSKGISISGIAWAQKDVMIIACTNGVDQLCHHQQLINRP